MTSRLRSRPAAALATVPAAVMLAGCSGLGPSTTKRGGQAAPSTTSGATFAALGRQAVRTLERDYSTGAGTWNTCLPKICGTGNIDWGDDSLTYSLYFHWWLTHDRGVIPIMNALAGTAYSYTPGTASWSDVPMWDTIADIRGYQVASPATRARWPRPRPPSVSSPSTTRPNSPSAPARASSTSSRAAEPAQDAGDRLQLHQGRAAVPGHPLSALPAGGHSGIQRDPGLLPGPRVPLYTVYVFDSGKACHQVPARYFGSVNGNMIWAGFWLARATGHGLYRQQALATAHAVQRHLADISGANNPSCTSRPLAAI